MSDLNELQTWMAGALQRRRAIERDKNLTAQARKNLGGNERMRPEDQLEVYREQFWLRHTSCLVEDFEALGAIVGQKQWERLVEEYLAAFPPQSFTLRDLGERLPEFVTRCDWLARHELCVDMARLEWAYVEVFDARDSAPLDSNQLNAIPEPAWQTARIELSPALRLLAVRYPVAQLRRKIRLQEEWELPDAPEPQHLVIYRGKDRNLHHDVISELAFALLEELGRGTPLVPAAEAVAQAHPGSEATLESELASWFQSFTERGWFAAVHPADT